MRAPLFAGLVLALASPAATAQVLVVDDSGGAGVDHTDLVSAIAAAADGDTLLIKAGTYSTFNPTEFLINGKAIALVAELNEVVNIASPVRVINLAAHQGVLLSGLNIAIVDAGTALTLSNNAGSVQVEDSVLSSGATVFPFLPAGNGLKADSCASVIVARCAITGSSIAGGSPGFHGSDLGSSNVCMYDCTTTGGAGGDGASIFQGGHGARLHAGSFLFASGTTFVGGQGGDGADEALFVPCTDGSPGGNGLLLDAGAPQASTLECTFTGGPGGAPGAGNPGCSPGATGSGLLVTSGSHTALTGTAHSFKTSSPVREGGVQTKVYEGVPGEFVFADLSPFQGFLYFPEFRGVLTLGSPLFIFFEGNIPASGKLEKTFVINEMGPGVEGVHVYMQAGFFDLNAGIFQGAASSLTLLDSSF